MTTPRAMFGCVVHKGQIVVTGGVNEEGLAAECEAYDFGTNKYVHVTTPTSYVQYSTAYGM